MLLLILILVFVVCEPLYRTMNVPLSVYVVVKRLSLKKDATLAEATAVHFSFEIAFALFGPHILCYWGKMSFSSKSPFLIMSHFYLDICYFK